jgi:dephospho-CoA kinase
MIIGLTGANASGKGEAGSYLKSKGFQYYSLSDTLREEARAKGIEPSRENLIKLGNELREKNGPSVLANLTIKKIKDKNNRVVIDSIRNPFEIKALRKLNGFTLIGVDAPLEMRYERAVARNRPGDPETLEEFVEKEKKENTGTSTNQQLENCLKAADVVIINDSSMEDFRKKIDETIAKIQKT